MAAGSNPAGRTKYRKPDSSSELSGFFVCIYDGLLMAIIVAAYFIMSVTIHSITSVCLGSQPRTAFALCPRTRLFEPSA